MSTETSIKIVSRGGFGGVGGVALAPTVAPPEEFLHNKQQHEERLHKSVVVPETTLQAVPPLVKTAASSSGEAFRIMSFNLRYDTKADGPNQWCHRRDLVYATIRLHGSEILGFQEALRTQINDLEHNLPEFAWTGVGRDDGKDKGEFCPIFWLRERFDCLDHGTFWLSETPEKPGSSSWGSACRRVATWARLQLKSRPKQELIFVNTHFDHHSEKARDESSRLLRQHLPPIVKQSNQRLQRSTSPPVVVIGDLNALENSKPLRILRGEEAEDTKESSTQQEEFTFADARLEAERKYNETVGSFTNWAGPEAEQQPQILIDHILYRGPLRSEAYGIICELWNGRRASDHRAAITDFRFSSS